MSYTQTTITEDTPEVAADFSDAEGLSSAIGQPGSFSIALAPRELGGGLEAPRILEKRKPPQYVQGQGRAALPEP